MPQNRRKFITHAASFIAGAGAAAASIPFIASLRPTRSKEDFLELSAIDIDISSLRENELWAVGWTRPTIIIRRTREQIEDLSKPNRRLADPKSELSKQPDNAKNYHRSIRPDVFVAVNVCPHTGCPLVFRPNYSVDPGAPENRRNEFLCPCHTSHFDLAGRVYVGMPARTNLEVPPYTYLSESVLRVGSSKADKAAPNITMESDT